MKELGIFVTLPFVLSIPPILGYYAGIWIDDKLDTKPYTMYILIVLGLIAGFKEMYRIITRYGHDI